MSIASITDLARALPSAVERSRGNQIGDLVRLSAVKSTSSNSSASAEVALLTQALGLQSQTASIRAASTNVAKASSLLQVADEGLQGIEQGLEVLNEIATLATRDGLTTDQRHTLQKQADEVVASIQKFAEKTSFNGANLLNGSFKSGTELGNKKAEDLNLNLGDYRTESLFKGAKIDVSSKAAAQESLKTLAPAGIEIATARAGVGALKQRFDMAGAALESALQNQEAARSSLFGSDDFTSSLFGISSSVENQSGVALLAQTNKLKPGVLDLLNS